MGKIYITNTALPILTGNVLSIFHFSATKTSSYAARLFCSLIVLTLGLLACRTALRVLLHWNPASDSNQQIRLEKHRFG